MRPPGLPLGAELLLEHLFLFEFGLLLFHKLGLGFPATIDLDQRAAKRLGILCRCGRQRFALFGGVDDLRLQLLGQFAERQFVDLLGDVVFVAEPDGVVVPDEPLRLGRQVPWAITSH